MEIDDIIQILSLNGIQTWYRRKDGKFHRTDGPAVITEAGTLYWYIDGNNYTFKGYCRKLSLSDEDILYLKLKYGC